MKIQNYRKPAAEFLAALILCSLIPPPLQAEFIFLKSGEIVEGSITSDSAKTVALETKDKKKIHVSRDNIMRVLYTKLKMAKVFIQKRDGKAIVAFIVDEDQESYTCRKELYSPEEFNLKRSDVLFMAEKNPSGLQPEGEIGTDSVTLTWLPPYGEIKRYNIYVKKNENSKYELVESSKDKSVTLKNLVSNTTYFVLVTSVDMDDYESTPSNELKIKTANLPPDKPVIISMEKNALDGAITYRWNHADDPDGKVVKYRIYGNRDNKREMVSEEKGDVYILKNPDSFNKLEMTAVDDLGDESEPAGLSLLKNMYTFSFYPGVIIPLGKFGDMSATGYGGMAFFGGRNLFFEGIDTGLGAGFYYSSGKDMSGEKKPVYDSFLIMPVLLNTGYRISLSDTFSIYPSVSFGMSFIAISYKSMDPLTLLYVKRSKDTIDPTVMAGLGAEYTISESTAVSVYAGYGMFIEKDGPMNFASLSFAFTYMFYK